MFAKVALKYVFLILVGVVLVALIATDNGRFLQSSLKDSVDDNRVLAAEPQPLEIPEPVEMAPPELPATLQLQAQAAISVEMGKDKLKTLFAKNENQTLPVASLTKLMTALVVLEHYDLSQKVIISNNAMAQEGTQGNMKPGQEFSAKSLMQSMLMESNNRAAYALSEVLGTAKFVSLMNENARNLGLASTHFADTTGLDSASYSTAKDIAMLTAYLFKTYPLFLQITSQQTYDLYLADGAFHHQMQNTNELLGRQSIIGGKTGFTSQAQGCFMAIQAAGEGGGYIVNVVLGSQDRFLEMETLIKFINK